ncbi:MAG: RluA family pseudouridine synthase [Kiritimatiellae bacterium]|jgi:23S rRNA pseudouridine1911/1915/1917 synthase|nr:RluA family pseudouridine synthase [Kiritimatiellia bacterium]
MQENMIPKPERLPLDIIFEDDDIIVIEKAPGIIVHPAPGYPSGTLLNALLHHCPKMAGVGSATRPGVVHRLDIETSGVMVFAKTNRAIKPLLKDFAEHTKIRKTYLGVVHGTMNPRKGTLDTLIGRKPWDPKRMAVVETKGQQAITHWEVLGKQGPISLVEFVIETGRTHQIRVHASHLGHPIAGDKLYGSDNLDRRMVQRPRRQLLHAVKLELNHPITKRRMEFVSSPPADIVYAR